MTKFFMVTQGHSKLQQYNVLLYLKQPYSLAQPGQTQLYLIESFLTPTIYTSD